MIGDIRIKFIDFVSLAFIICDLLLDFQMKYFNQQICLLVPFYYMGGGDADASHICFMVL